MKRFCAILIAIVILFTSYTFQVQSKVKSHGNPEDPNLAYPIIPIQDDGDSLPQNMLMNTPLYTYPIEGLELPSLPLEDSFKELDEFEYDIPLPSPEMVEIELYEEQEEFYYPDPPFLIDVEPSIYIEGKPVTLHLKLSESEQSHLTEKVLSITLPQGLIPVDDQYSESLNTDGILTISLESFPGSIAFKETLPIIEIGSDLTFSMSIFSNEEEVFTKTISLPTHGFHLDNNQIFPTTDIPVHIQAQDETITNNLLFYAGALRSQSIPGYSLSFNPVEILAVDPVSGLNVRTFEQPLQISLGYPEGEFTPEEEDNLQAFYFNELYKDWFPIETITDAASNQVHFQTNHLTVFDIKVADWQSYIPPITQSYEVSAFTGAMNYSYPLLTFEGPGGLKPDLTLSYNSQTIDQSIAYTQASWVGMGWSLEAGSVTRDMHGTDDDPDDDTFFISYNGISQRLLPISEENGVIQYRTQENPTEKIFWNTTANTWEVRSGDGLIYTFGGTNSVAKLKKGSGCAEAVDDLNLTWEWGLTSVVDRFGNTIAYEYVPEVKGVSDTDTDEDKYCHNHINLTLSKILYGSFEIKFVTATRYDYRSSWQHYNSKVLFTRNRLDHVDLKVNDSIVKSYLFRYAANTETSNVIYPNFIWFRGSKTSTLISLQEVQTSGVSPVQGYEKITFSYAADHMHLNEINNGYGGRIQLTYVPMYQADDVNKDVRSARWCFGSQGCPGNNPLLTTYCVASNPDRGWRGDHTLVACDPSASDGNLKLYHNGSIDSTAFRPFPEAMIKPGGRYIFYGKAQDIEHGTNTQFGFTTGVPVTAATNPISVPESFMTTSASPWVYGQEYLVMPAEYNFDSVQLYLMNQGLLVKDLQVQQFITRYVVTQRTETDTITGKSATWTYDYPSEGFKMNVGAGTNPYVKTKMEYRGFSSVTITQQEGSRQDSLITVQNFHQDDLLKGRLSSEIVKDNIGLCYSQSLYSYETSTLYSYTQLIGLNTYTDLNINWKKATSIEKQSYSGANCNSLPTSPHLATKEVYTYTPATDYLSSLNGNPLSITQKVYNGVAWLVEYAIWNEYESSIDQLIDAKTYFFSGDLKNTRIKTCVSGTCNGELLAETLYSYNSNRTASSQKVWAKGLESGREYRQISYTYHSNGNIASKTEWQEFATASANPAGASLVTQCTYDNVFPSRVTQETINANGTTYITETLYDPRFGLPIQVTHPNGAVESAVYDGLGRTIRICAPGDAANYSACKDEGSFTLNITYELTLIPPRVTIERRSMASIRMEYTGFGKLQTRTILSAEINGVVTHWVESDYEYDGLGRIIRETNAGLSSFSKYDVLGKLIEMGRSSGSGEEEIASYTYAIETLGSQIVWKTSIEDANDKISYSYANVKGQVIKTSPPTGSGPSVLITYDLLGRLTQTTYGNATTTIQYNPAGLKTQMVDPDMGTWTYTYDAQGNLLTQTSATNTTTLTYDGLNRVISKSFSDGSPAVSFTYDTNGDTGYRTGMTDGSGTTAWDYDPRGRLIKEDKTISGQAFTTLYTYDSADQLISMTYPNGETVIITNLPQGGNKTIGSYLTGTVVNANGRVSERSFGNGATTNLTYNDWLTGGSQLSTLQSGQSGSLINLGFTYDSVGNITSITDNLNSSQVQTFTYDSMDRLTTASTNAVGVGQYMQTYSYDATTGNLNSKSDVGAYTYSSTQPHAVTQAGANSYAYDQNGNMISRTVEVVEWTYTYNADGQLTQIRKNNQLVSEYGYDGDGKRVWSKDYEGYPTGELKETIFIGNYYEFVTEVRAPEPGEGGVCTGTYCTYLPMIYQMPHGISYYYADGQRIAMRDNDGVVSYLYGDQLGSVSTVADASGSLVSRTLYEPWGEIRHTEGTSPTEYGYTGQMQEGDIYFYNARWYDPAIGSFMQPDTIVPLQVQGTQAFDRYAYVNNNPLRYSDPSGYRACDDYYGSGCNVISLPSPNPIFNVSVCGLGDSALFCGQTGANVPLSPYLSWNGQHHSFFVQGSSKADTSVRVVDYLRTLPTKAKIRFIGHSAGADAIILTFHSLLKMNIIGNLDIAGIVLLDPTLTANYSFEPGSNMSTYFDEMIVSEIRTFVAITTGYDSEGRIIPNINTVELLSYGNYTFERNVPLTHAELALSADIAERAERWILEGVK